MQWSNVSDRHMMRIVLVVAPIINSISIIDEKLKRRVKIKFKVKYLIDINTLRLDRFND